MGTGVGLRTSHYSDVLSGRPTVSWFEVITENYLGIDGRAGGKPFRVLEAVRDRFPIVFHGVSLSVGSADPLDEAYLVRLKQLAERFEPAWISDHLCWTGVRGENLHDLLPLPYTEEALSHVAERVARVQDALGRRFVLENVSSYVTFPASTMTEWEFLAELVKRTGCALLVDVNNIYVSSRNHGFDPHAFLDAIPREAVAQFHLAGHSDMGNYVIDTHDEEVCPAVWDLYRAALRRFGPVSTLIEWDAELPTYARLEEEAERARAIQREVLGG